MPSSCGVGMCFGMPTANAVQVPMLLAGLAFVTSDLAKVNLCYNRRGNFVPYILPVGEH